VVFTPDEARAVLAKMHGTTRLMAQLLYGGGLRVMECVRLRIKDIDFGYLQITVRDAKGGRDRITMLPVSLVESLRRQVVGFSNDPIRFCKGRRAAGANGINPLTRRAGDSSR
jgi:integrase